MHKNRKPLKVPIKIRVTFNDDLLHEQVFHDYPIVIGRNKNCDIALSDFDYVSRQHIVIALEEDDKLYFTDLNSSNAFLYQGIVTRKQQIFSNTSVAIGPVKINVTTVKKESVSEKPPTAILDDELTKTEFDTVKTEIDLSEPESPLFLDAIDEASSKADVASLPVEAISPPSKAVNLPKEKASPVMVDEIDGQIIVSSKQHQKKILSLHPFAKSLNKSNRVLETYVQWQDQFYAHQNFYPNNKISIGSSPKASLYIPFIKGDVGIAYFDEESSKCLIPNGMDASLNRSGKDINIKELISAGLVARKSRGYILQLENEDVLSVRYNKSTSLLFRYAPAPKRLSKRPMLNPDEEIRKSFTASFIIHFFIIVLAFLSPAPNTPEIKDVPKRYAKLLVQPPKKIIELPKKPEPKPTPPPVEKKPEPKKPVPPKPKPVEKKRVVQKKPIKKQVIKPNPQVQKENTPVKKPEPDIKQLGALAALGSMKPTNDQQQVAVNINKNAGGARQSLNTSGIVSDLKTDSGKLASSGSQGVQTRGLGVGSGEGFGTQGLQGRAGTRGVGGAVVGTPNLEKSSKTEGLTSKQVMDTLKKYVSQIQRCYERSLFDNPNLKGRVEYQWEISAAGKVQWAKVVKSDMSGADSLNDCVKKVFLSMQFPRAKNGQTTIPKIGFPFGRL